MPDLTLTQRQALAACVMLRANTYRQDLSLLRLRPVRPAVGTETVPDG